MTRYISAGLSRENDTQIGEGATTVAVNAALSKDCSSPASVYGSRKQQFLENRFKQKIVCEYYDAIKDDFFSFEGIILSIEVDGLSFIAERSVEMDMPVLIKRKTPLNDCSEGALDKGKHAQVVSCKKAEDQNQESCYRIFVQYF